LVFSGEGGKKMKRIGIALMIIAGIVAGVFVGAYYSEPIMAGIVDSQTSQINGLKEKLGICQDDKDFYLDEVSIMNDTIGDIGKCYTTLFKDVNPVSISKFKTCMDKELK
jgi:hypothetical protein